MAQLSGATAFHRGSVLGAPVALAAAGISGLRKC
jgi:hypothetical protein